MLLSFQMLPEQPAPELLDAVALADGLGYHGCYSADEIYHKDAWLLFAAAAQRTERIRLGPCVAPIYMREPTYIAQLAATLDELSGGRAEVVFGIGNIAMLEQYGIEWRGTRPIARLREAHQVMRTVLDEGAIDFKGDFYSYTGVTTAARPVQEHLPLKVGAMGGPKSMQLAGEIADGLHTACAYSPEALRYAVDQFRVGVERTGRSLDGLDLGDSLLGAIARCVRSCHEQRLLQHRTAGGPQVRKLHRGWAFMGRNGQKAHLAAAPALELLATFDVKNR